MIPARQPWDVADVTAVQATALRAIAATGSAGLPWRVNGRKAINGNADYALRGSRDHRLAQREPLIEVRDHGFVRNVRMRWGGTYPEHDMRYHLTDAGRALLAQIGAA